MTVGCLDREKELLPPARLQAELLWCFLDSLRAAGVPDLPDQNLVLVVGRGPTLPPHLQPPGNSPALLLPDFSPNPFPLLSSGVSGFPVSLTWSVGISRLFLPVFLHSCWGFRRNGNTEARRRSLGRATLLAAPASER